MNPLISIRDMVLNWAAWVSAGVQGKLLYVIGVHFDQLIAWAQSALFAAFPGFNDDYETLPIHSRARLMPQGVGESNKSFAMRLEGFREMHAFRGGPYRLLEQVYARYRFSDDGSFPVHLVYPSGRYFYMGTDGNIQRPAFVPGFTSGNTAWANWWLVYEWPETIDDDGLWDDEGPDGGFWDNPEPLAAGAWDVQLPYDTIASLRAIPELMTNAHSIGHLVLLGPGQAMWDIPDEDWDSDEDWDEGGDTDVELIIM